MSDNTKARAAKLTHIQKEAMVDFMELNPKLRGGKFTKEFTTKMAEKLWQDLSEFLNSLPGGQKDVNQWRKTWQDLKTTVKEKSANNSKESNRTGGGKAALCVLSELETRVSSLIGNTNINGHPRIEESSVKMNWQPSPKTVDVEDSFEHPIILDISNDDPDTDILIGSTVSIISELSKSPQPSTSRSGLDSQAQNTPKRACASLNTNQHDSRVAQQPLHHNGNFSSKQNTTQRPSTNATISKVAHLLSANRVPEQLPASSAGSKRPRIGVQRFENTIEASDNLVLTLQNKNKMKERYYKAKLELLGKKIAIQDRIAKSLEDIASGIKRSSDFQ